MWRRLFPLVFLFSCVDGFISNWMYPDRVALLYRDIFILVVYLLFLLHEPVATWLSRLRERVGAATWLFGMAFLCLGVLQVFNPLSPGVVVGLLGFKVVFFYWPLALLAYAYVDRLERARALLRLIAWMSIPVSLFGIYQFWQGPEFLAATFGPGFEAATVQAHVEGMDDDESFVRVIGTFASTGQFTGFLLVSITLALALFFSSPTRCEALVWVGCALVNFLALLATGSRGGLVMLAVAGALVPVFSRRAGRVLVLGALAGLGLWAGFGWLGEDVAARFQTLRDVDMVRHRTVETTSKMFTVVLDRYPLGRGLGTGSSASRHVLGEDSGDWELVENDPSKILLETGLVGVLLFYGFLVALGLRWVRRWHRPMDEATIRLAVPLSAYCLMRFLAAFVVGGFDSPPASIFLWALVGMIARLASPAGGPAGAKPGLSRQRVEAA